MSKPVRVAILFSGRGSNMETLAQHLAKPDVPGQFVLGVSNRPEAGGIGFCTRANIPCAVIDHKAYDTREDFESDMQKALASARIDLICAAGFMRLLTPEFVTHWHNRIINIHPSLLPAYKGLNTHKRALDDGAKQHGCSVHYMRAEMDDGPVIVQKHVPVHADDTPDTLATRVLAQEHVAYPEALDIVLEKLASQQP